MKIVPNNTPEVGMVYTSLHQDDGTPYRVDFVLDEEKKSKFVCTSYCRDVNFFPYKRTQSMSKRNISRFDLIGKLGITHSIENGRLVEIERDDCFYKKGSVIRPAGDSCICAILDVWEIDGRDIPIVMWQDGSVSKLNPCSHTLYGYLGIQFKIDYFDKIIGG